MEDEEYEVVDTVDETLDDIPEEPEEEGEDTDRGAPMFLPEKSQNPIFLHNLNPNMPLETKQSLSKTFGPFIANYFINPHAPPARHLPPDAIDLTSLPKPGATESWTALRTKSLRSLQFEDWSIPPSLKETFSAYTRQKKAENPSSIQHHKKAPRRFYYWNSQDGKEMPDEEFYPIDRYSKALLRKRRAVNYCNMLSTRHEDRAVMLMHDNPPPGYEDDVHHQGPARLLRHSDVIEAHRKNSLGIDIRSESSHRATAVTERSGDSSQGDKLYYVGEEWLSSGRPEFSSRFSDGADFGRNVKPPKPLISRLNNSVMASHRLFSAREPQLPRLRPPSQANKRESSAPASVKWTPLTLGDLADSIPLREPSGMVKPLTAA